MYGIIGGCKLSILNEDNVIATISHFIMLFILIVVMDFPALSVFICYATGFITPVVLKFIWKWIKIFYR